MDNTVIVALISLIGTLSGSLGGVLVSSKLTNYRIGQLEKKQEKYNNLIERTFKLEERMEVADEKIKVANHRLEDLEHERKD
ncbi:MAG: hemolysin XhlA family protein [Ruminococcus sp.]|nr:hemolysin XhlA family protein [Ruminococcus sp.]